MENGGCMSCHTEPIITFLMMILLCGPTPNYRSFPRGRKMEFQKSSAKTICDEPDHIHLCSDIDRTVIPRRIKPHFHGEYFTRLWGQRVHWRSFTLLSHTKSRNEPNDLIDLNFLMPLFIFTLLLFETCCCDW